MSVLGLVIGTIVALGLSAFFSGTETGIYCLNHVRLDLRYTQHQPRAARLVALMKRPRELVITTLVGTNVADYLATVCVTAIFLHYSPHGNLAQIYATAVLTPLILVFGGVLPKDWFQREADRLMYPLATSLTWCQNLVRWIGLIWVLNRITLFLIQKIDPTGIAEEADLLPRARIRRLLSEGAASGGLSEFQRDTLERVMNISCVRLGNVMIPRRRAALVPVGIPRADLLRIARMAHFSRLPVYRDDPRRIIGVINVYDVLTDLQERPIAEYVQEITALRVTETVPAALLKMQAARQVMAIVTDRLGNCLGLFTMKDLVEEIVGDLEAW